MLRRYYIKSFTPFKVKKREIIILILTLLMPLYTLALVFFEFIKKNSSRFNIISASFVFAYFAFFIEPPMEYDLFRHYEKINSLRGLSFISAVNISDPGYILFNAYAWLINVLGLPKQFFTASVVFTSYFLVFSVFFDFKLRCLNKERKQTLLIVFCVVWLSIGFVGIASGIRNGLANIIIFYVGYHFIYYNKLSLFICGSIFAFFIHPFAALPALLIVFSKKLSGLAQYGKMLVLIAAVFIFLPKLTTYIVGYLYEILESISFVKMEYFQGDSEWGGGFYQIRSIYGLIANLGIQYLSFYIAMIYLLISKPEKNDPIYFLVCCLACVAGVFFFFYNFSVRVIAIFIYFFSFYISYKYVVRKNNTNKIFICLILGSLVFNSIFSFYTFRDFLFSSYDFLYKPPPLVLLGF